ncbi:MAG: DUF3540 domain-containing protein [Polyangiaceae bacterium]
MTMFAPKLERDEIFQERATVVAVDGRRVTVSTPFGVMVAERAASCLVTPRPDDQVLLASSRRGDAWVLAVLVRGDEDAEVALEVEGDLAIRARGGQLDLGGRRGVSLTTAGDLDATSAGLRLRTVDADVAVERLTFFGRQLLSEVERLRSVATVVDGVFGRLSQRVKQSFRHVEEIDHVKAQQIDYRAAETACLRSKHCVVTADELVKIDGGQIHLG